MELGHKRWVSHSLVIQSSSGFVLPSVSEFQTSSFFQFSNVWMIYSFTATWKRSSFFSEFVSFLALNSLSDVANGNQHMLLTLCYEFTCYIISLPGCRKQLTKSLPGKHQSTLSNDNCLLMTTKSWNHKAHTLRFLSFLLLQEHLISDTSLCPSKNGLSWALLISNSQMLTI